MEENNQIPKSSKIEDVSFEKLEKYFVDNNINIINILKKNKLKYIKKIVIQSNTDIPLIRKYINKLGYTIKNEQLIIDKNIYYIIITFTKGKHKYTKKELYFGPILLKENNYLFNEKKAIELNKLEEILKKIPSKKIITKYKLKKLIKLYKN